MRLPATFSNGTGSAPSPRAATITPKTPSLIRSAQVQPRRGASSRFAGERAVVQCHMLARNEPTEGVAETNDLDAVMLEGGLADAADGGVESRAGSCGAADYKSAVRAVRQVHRQLGDVPPSELRSG